MSKEEQKEEIVEMIDLGKELQKSIGGIDFISGTVSEEDKKHAQFFLNNYERWYSKAYAVIKTFLPDRLDDFIKLYKDDKRKVITRDSYCISDALRLSIGPGYNPNDASWLIRQQAKILQSCLDCFDSRLYDIQATIQADLFDSEIDSAKHLLKLGFLRPAGAICGVVMEKHLSQTCANRGIALRKSSPGINDYNEALKDNAYGTIEWRKIQHLADIRNLCDHSKEREPTKDEVSELIAGADWLIKNIF